MKDFIKVSVASVASLLLFHGLSVPLFKLYGKAELDQDKFRELAQLDSLTYLLDLC